MTRLLVTGGGGLVGSTVLAAAPRGPELHATRRRSPVAGAEVHPADLADEAATLRLVRRLVPDVVLHAAYDPVALERDVVAASASVAGACRAIGAALVHLSSDVVFDGEHAPYGEEAPLAPISAYGRAKARTEEAVRAAVPDAAVVRTSLVCSADPLDPRSARVVDGLRAGEEVRLFTDEVRCPIRADDLAALLWDLLARPRAERAGPWHLVGPEALSRYDLGCLLADAHGLDRDGIVAARSAEQPEPRPRDLRLTAARAEAALATRPRPVATLFAP